MFDPEGVHLVSGVNLKKLRSFVNEKLTTIDTTDELDITEDQLYDLHLKLKKLQGYITFKTAFCSQTLQKYEEERHAIMLE